MTKNKGGRPPKLTDQFLEVAEKVLNERRNAFILTDEELLDLINEQLPQRKRVAGRTFEDWKAGKIKSSRAVGFRGLLKKTLIRQKLDLFTRLESARGRSWTKYAWMIERKFDEWNIRQKTDLSTLGKEISWEVNIAHHHPQITPQGEQADEENQDKPAS
jgi:hypothetical protein